MSQEEIDKKFWEIVQGERCDQGQGKSTGGGTPGWLRWGFKVSEEGFFFSMLVGEGELAVSLAELIVETEMEARAADVYLAELEAQSEVVQQARTNIPLDANGDVTSWDDPAAPELATDGAGARSGGGCAATELGDGPGRTFTHFTDEGGAVGISGTKPLAVGDSVGVDQLSFAKGENPFLASEPGRVFVTDLGPGATPRQLEGIGVFGARQQYAIEFSEADAFASGARVVGEVPSRGIYSIPGGCTINGACSRIAAVEARIAAAQIEARSCVAELMVDDGARFLIAERLPALGTAILPSVHELLADPDVDAEVRGLAALCGLAVGDSGPSVVREHN